MHPSPRFVPLAALCLIAVSACSIFTRSIERPTADVRDVAVSRAGWSGVSGALHLDVTNPNNFGVPLSGIDWELTVGGARAVTGTTSLSQTIPARGVAPVTTSLTLAASDAILVAGELARGARTYHLSARLHFTTPIGPLEVTVIHTGELADGATVIGPGRGIRGSWAGAGQASRRS